MRTIVQAVWVLFLIAVSWCCPAAALQVEAAAGRPEIGLAESLQIQVRLHDPLDSRPDFSVLQENWEVLRQSKETRTPSTGKKTDIYNLILLPRRQGVLSVPAICSNNECSEPLSIKVVPGSTLKYPVEEQVLLETEISPRKIMARGKALLKVRLWLRPAFPVGELSEPDIDESLARVVALKTPPPKVVTRDNGVAYQLIERHYEIFPQQGGVIEIPPVHYVGPVVGVPTRFDPFVKKGLLARVSSPFTTLKVTSLPEAPRQATELAAATLSLEDDWPEGPLTYRLGEPIRRTLRLRAEGIDAKDLPELKLPAPEGFKVYYEPARRETEHNDQGLSATLEQTLTLIPTRPGVYRLPEVALSWWDTRAARLRQVRLAARTVNILPVASSNSAAAPPGAPPEDAAAPRPVTPAQGERSGTAGLWPWLSLGLCLSWGLSLVFIWRRRSGGNPSPDQGDDRAANEQAARKAVIRAARSHEPQASRRALVRWSETLFPARARRASHYEALYQGCPARLQEELRTLDQVLYGSGSSSWDGQRLAAAVAAWQPEKAVRRSADLPALYPADNQTERGGGDVQGHNRGGG